MEYNASAFYTIAQIAITLTGFIAVLVAIQHEDNKFSRLAVVTIFGTTGGALIFAFIPDLLMNIMKTETAWRIACGTFGIYHLGLIFNHQIRQLQFKKNSPTQLAIVILSIFPVVFLKIAVGFGFFLYCANEIFLLGLVWCIFIPLYLFAMIILAYTKDNSD
jgi:hypothetical protein